MIKIETIDKSYEYYKTHQNELTKQYLYRFLVISENNIIWDYDSQEQAYFEAIKTHKPWTFIIQQCLPKEEEEKVIFHSRVCFV